MMNSPTVSFCKTQKQQDHPIQSDNFYSTKHIDRLLAGYINLQALQETNTDILQEHSQFEDRLAYEIQRDFQSLSIAQKQTLTNKDGTSIHNLRAQIKDQIGQQLKRPEQSKELKLMKADVHSIQLNERLFVYKHFGSHFIMNRQMTEAGRHIFMQHQYLITIQSRFKRTQDQTVKEKIHALNDFYKMRMNEFEMILPEEKHTLLKNVLPRKIAVFKKRTSKQNVVNKQE